MKKGYSSLIFIFSLFIIISCSTESTPVYQLNTSADPVEAGSVTPSEGEYEEGEQVEITASPNEHWVFNGWGGDNSGSENPASIVMDQDKSVTALFVKQDYPLTIEKVGEGTVNQRVIQSKTTDYPHGTEVELTAEPDDGWEFIMWSGDTSGDENPINITVEAETTVTATFERIDYPLTITIEGEGTVEQEVVQSKTTEYPFQTVVQLTPIPSDDWQFLEWSGDTESEDEVIEVTINEETNITAIFEQPFFLHTNGVTIMCPNTNSGDKGIVDGVEYESVDRELLSQRRDQGTDLTRVCTSLVTNMSNLFKDSTFNQPIGNWDVSNVNNMNGMFMSSFFNQSIGEWDVSKVTNMGRMFNNSNFNQPIGNWDVSSVTIMFGLFQNTPFNQPIGDWDVNNAIRMNYMFASSNFNQSIGNWDVSSVETMEGMFYSSVFNKPIGNWDVSNVEEMNSMFFNTPFDQPIGDWDVSNVRDMNGMFRFGQFNRSIGDWDVSNVQEMIVMFDRSEFNQPIGDWDVSNVRNMDRMFKESPFNQSIGNWDVGNVRDMNRMFRNSPFNQPIGDWNVNNVTNMDSMFSSGEFDQTIGNWDVSNVRNMDSMFYNTPFNHDINGWCVSNIPTEPERFSTHSPLTEENKPVWGTCPD